jgi:hypothetical protein
MLRDRSAMLSGQAQMNGRKLFYADLLQSS